MSRIPLHRLMESTKLGDDMEEGVIGRKMVFCPRLEEFSTKELIRSCEACDGFLVYCCNCSKRYGQDGYRNGHPCHHFRLIFTDGACRSNGQTDATAGLGVAVGRGDSRQISKPITTAIDSGRRTSQRAELLAAVVGVQWITVEQEHRGDSRNIGPPDSWVIATDSEYVVKGVTEWLPTWKKNKLRTNRNTEPANLDLFLRIDMEIAEAEEKTKVKIGFWHVLREYNAIADRLAKKAASEGDPE
ncbi:MAG: hypothetical protein Q9220_006295 [cf. Caloplaca sp. 1 TL-2023]